MDLDISGRRAVVGGASSGLGRASALRLAEAGCELLIWARGRESLDRTRAELLAAGSPRVVSIAADAASPGAAQELADAVAEHWGSADILVLNAGGPPTSDPMNGDADGLRTALQLLVETPIDLATRLLPAMRAQRWGRIVAILSWGVREPVPALPYSNIGRSGLAAWMKSASQRAAAEGVTINGVLPGRFMTPRIEALDRGAARYQGVPVSDVHARAREDIPAGRDGDPDELGSMVAFLCSQPAAYVNGAFVPVDGGMLKSLG